MKEVINKSKLNAVIKDVGMLLLNENKHLLSVMELGGDWDTIISLIEEREVFYSKVYKKRTTYLSKELYFLLKKYRQKVIKGKIEQEVYEFLTQCGGADTRMIKSFLLLDDKEIKEIMNNLLESMNVTVLCRAKLINSQWTSFVWGTFEQWEKSCKSIEINKDEEVIKKEIENILIKSMSIKEINNFLCGRKENGYSFIQDF